MPPVRSLSQYRGGTPQPRCSQLSHLQRNISMRSQCRRRRTTRNFLWAMNDLLEGVNVRLCRGEMVACTEITDRIAAQDTFRRIGIAAVKRGRYTQISLQGDNVGLFVCHIRLSSCLTRLLALLKCCYQAIIFGIVALCCGGFGI